MRSLWDRFAECGCYLFVIALGFMFVAAVFRLGLLVGLSR